MSSSAKPWSAEEQVTLDAALRATQGRSFSTAKERWGTVASQVPNRSPRECAERFQAVRRALREQHHHSDTPLDTGKANTTDTRENLAAHPATHRQNEVPRETQQEVRAAGAATSALPVPQSAGSSSGEAATGTDEAVEKVTVDFWGLATTATTLTPTPQAPPVPPPPPVKPQSSGTISVHKRDSQTNGWWRKSIAVDLLTQQPIAKLPYAPFRFVAAQTGGAAKRTIGSRLEEILFDGEVLALYLVSTGRLRNPVSKAAITESQAKSLDSYLLQHFLKPAHVKVALALTRDATNLCGAGKQNSDHGSASELEERICELRDNATTALESVLKDSLGLTPLLERALVGDMVGFGWEPLLEQLRDVQARQSALQTAHHAQMLRRRMEEAARKHNAHGATRAHDVSTDDMHAAMMIRARMDEHRRRTGGGGGGNYTSAAAGDAVVRPIESIKANKAARNRSKTGAVNYLLATAPHMSSRVQAATGASVWGSTSGGNPGLPAPGAPTAAVNKKKKKKKKAKQNLQGLAMKMK